MRIAIFTDTYLPQINGVVRSLVTTIDELLNRGHEVFVYTMDTAKLAAKGLKSAQRAPDVKLRTYFSVAAPGFPDVQCRVPTYFGPARQVKRDAPDLIHCHTNFTIAWEAHWISRTLKIPLVAHHHGLLAEYLRNFGVTSDWAKMVMRRHLARSYNSCAAVVTPSAALVNELRQYGCRIPIHKISNPVDKSMFEPPIERVTRTTGTHGRSSDRRKVVHVGRLVPQKSVDMLLRAFACVLGSGLDAELVIIGDGRERPQLQQLSRSLGVAHRVRWTGVLEGRALRKEIAGCDVFASASATETQGLVFLEAMALGLPCVGVNAGGVPEYVRHGIEGYIAPAGECAEFAEALRTLLSSAQLRRSCAANARRAATQFQAGTVVDAIEGVYYAVTESRNFATHKALGTDAAFR